MNPDDINNPLLKSISPKGERNYKQEVIDQLIQSAKNSFPITQVPGMAKQYVYDPERQRLFPQSPYYPENRDMSNPENQTSLGLMVGGVKSLKNYQIPDIHIDDQRTMSDFIDVARGIQKVPGDDVLAGTRIAERYNMPIPKTMTGLANVFDEILSRIRQQPLKQIIPK